MLPISIHSAQSPISHHVLDTTEILGLEFLFQLLARQPFKIRVPERITLEISLASHDAALEEEGLLTLLRNGAILAYYGVDDDVGDGNTANDPGVHVDAGSLVEDSFRSLIH